MMLNNSILQIAEGLITTQLDERARHIRDESERIHNEMAERGVASSGGTIWRIRRLCENELQIRAQQIVEKLATVVSTANIRPYDTLNDDLKREMENYFLPEVEKLQHMVDKVARLIGGIGNQDTSLEEARERALKKAWAQIDLFVLGFTQAEEVRQPTQRVTVYGSVGVVQVGTGATAHVTQTIPIDDGQRLVEALERVREEVEARGEVEEYARKDLIAVIDDARSDASKEQPNMLRLRSLSFTIATTIQTVAALRPAYEFLKGALLPLGVVLP